MKKIIITDLDGTFLDSENKFSTKFVNYCIENNIDIGIATGRLLHDIYEVEKRIGLKMPIYIAQNGAVVANDKQEIINEELISFDVIKKMIELNKKYDFRLEINTAKNRYFETPRDESFPKEFFDSSIIKKFSELNEDLKYVGILIISDKVDNLKSEIANLVNDPSVIVEQTSKTSIEIYNANSSKGNAIELIKEKYDDIYVVGDASNDVSMFEKFYEKSFVIKGSNKEVMSSAKKAINSIDEVIKEI